MHKVFATVLLPAALSVGLFEAGDHIPQDPNAFLQIERDNQEPYIIDLVHITTYTFSALTAIQAINHASILIWSSKRKRNTENETVI